MQRLLNHSLLLLILFALMAATVSHAFGQNLEGRIEFHGRHYNSLEEILQEQSSASYTQAPSLLGCGPRMTREVLIRGYYDFRVDSVVCFSSHSESDRLYAKNKALILEYGLATSTSPSANTLHSSHYRCPDYDHGAPYLGYFYLHPVDEVCLSNPAERAQSHWRFRSYWQQGRGRTYFFYRYNSGRFWWLDWPTVWTPPEVQGHAMRSYQWCVGGTGCP